jgi:hypothetical protein
MSKKKREDEDVSTCTLVTYTVVGVVVAYLTINALTVSFNYYHLYKDVTRFRNCLSIAYLVSTGDPLKRTFDHNDCLENFRTKEGYE